MLKHFLLITGLAVLFYLTPQIVGVSWGQIYENYFPCSRPIPYSIGSFDKDFDLSEKEFLDALKIAESIWEKPSGKNLFVYKPQNKRGNLEINLVYDFRQQATETIEAINESTSGTRSEYDVLKARYDSLKAEYLEIKRTYQSRVSSFEERSEAYKKKVEYWNSRGGAPREEYDAMKREEAALKSELNAIKNLEQQVNSKVGPLNDMAHELNALAAKLNLTAETVEDINDARGEEFTEGEYREEGGERMINVYEFSTKIKLIRLLAHEFGHALGLEHVDDSEAIMYYLNENKNGSLSSLDLEALNALCGAK